MEEKKYAKYHIYIEYDYTKENENKNSSLSSEILIKEDSLKEINKFVKNTFKYREKFKKELNIVTKKIEIKFIEFTTWCLTWFSHYTYNTNLSNSELLESFEKYVDEKKEFNFNINEESIISFEARVPKEKRICLMGAEDRWRWKLCRCKHCQKQGVVRIDH